MKKIFYLMAVCAAAAACAKQNPEIVPEQSVQTEERVSFSVGIPEVTTRSTEGNVGDATVASLQVFVFDKVGSRLDNYVKGTSKSVEVDCTKGRKMIYAVVNAPDLGGIKTEPELKEAVSAIADNTKSKFVMTGSEEVEITGMQGDVTIHVNRKLVKICLTRIVNKITMPQYKTLPFVVKAVYLVNVAADIPYFVDKENTSWVNFKKATEMKNDFYYDAVEDVQIPAPGTYETTHSFYCYPNLTKVDSSKPDNDARRFTRLVVEATLGEQKYYYPINVTDMVSNNTYQISLAVTRPGSESPDIPVDKYSANASIDVIPWNVHDVVEDEI